MANNKNKNYKSKNGYDQNKRTKELKKLAYDMGLVKRGLKNPDSLITSSYNRGLQEPKRDYKKKTLF